MWKSGAEVRISKSSTCKIYTFARCCQRERNKYDVYYVYIERSPRNRNLRMTETWKMGGNYACHAVPVIVLLQTNPIVMSRFIYLCELLMRLEPSETPSGCRRNDRAKSVWIWCAFLTFENDGISIFRAKRATSTCLGMTGKSCLANLPNLILIFSLLRRIATALIPIYLPHIAHQTNRYSHCVWII